MVRIKLKYKFSRNSKYIFLINNKKINNKFTCNTSNIVILEQEYNILLSKKRFIFMIIDYVSMLGLSKPGDIFDSISSELSTKSIELTSLEENVILEFNPDGKFRSIIGGEAQVKDLGKVDNILIKERIIRYRKNAPIFATISIIVYLFIIVIIIFVL